jgi:RNA polymerase sigma-70 factor (ECF subfamily)
LAVLKDPHDAEDAAQAAFIKAFRALPRFRQDSVFRTWLTRIALNQCKDALRQRRRRGMVSLDAVLEAGAPLPTALVQPASDPMDAALPAGALAVLTQAERDILQLVRDEEGISYEAVAQHLGLSLDGVKGRLKRARMKLRQYLGMETA